MLAKHFVDLQTVVPVDANLNHHAHDTMYMLINIHLVPELFCQKTDLLEFVSFLCTFLQHAVR